MPSSFKNSFIDFIEFYRFSLSAHVLLFIRDHVFTLKEKYHESRLAAVGYGTVINRVGLDNALGFLGDAL